MLETFQDDKTLAFYDITGMRELTVSHNVRIFLLAVMSSCVNRAAGAKGMTPGSLPLFLREERQKLFLACIGVTHPSAPTLSP